MTSSRSTESRVSAGGAAWVGLARSAAADPWLLTLILVSISARLALWIVYAGPVAFPDTGTYERAARELMRIGGEHLGARTPVYALVLMAAAFNHHAVWVLQNALGVASAGMVYAILRLEAASRPLAFAVAVASSLAMNTLFFEATVLTETLASAWLVLLALLMARLHAAPASGAGRQAAGVGMVAALAGLTRPHLLYVLPVAALFAGLTARGAPARRAGMGARAFAWGGLLLAVWCGYNGLTAGFVGPTSLTGYHLTQHSGGFMELAPDEFAVIRDIYLEGRARHVAETGGHEGTIWRVQERMREATGLAFVDLSRRLTRLSVGLFVAHPARYLRSVGEAWRRFWGSTVYWDQTRVEPPALGERLRRLWGVEAWVLALVKWTFFAAALGHLVSWIGRGRRMSPPVAFMVSLVLAGSVVGAATERGGLDRHSFPFQPLVLMATALLLTSLVRRLAPADGRVSERIRRREPVGR